MMSLKRRRKSWSEFHSFRRSLKNRKCSKMRSKENSTMPISSWAKWEETRWTQPSRPPMNLKIKRSRPTRTSRRCPKQQWTLIKWTCFKTQTWTSFIKDPILSHWRWCLEDPMGSLDLLAHSARADSASHKCFITIWISHSKIFGSLSSSQEERIRGFRAQSTRRHRLVSLDPRKLVACIIRIWTWVLLQLVSLAYRTAILILIWCIL